MKFLKKVTIEVNGKKLEATVTLDAPGLEPDSDCLTPEMILVAVASHQNQQFYSRHHDRNRVARVMVKPDVAQSPALVRRPLRLVA